MNRIYNRWLSIIDQYGDMPESEHVYLREQENECVRKLRKLGCTRREIAMRLQEVHYVH